MVDTGVYAAQLHEAFLNSVTDEILERELESLDDSFHQIKKTHSLQNVDINLITLYLTIKSYAYDLLRYGAFHNSHNEHAIYVTDGIKQAAFLTKWILKFRPVTFSILDEEIDKLSVQEYFSNELFAFLVGLSRCFGKDYETLTDVNMDENFKLNLLYSFKYRKIDYGGLIMIYHAIHELKK